MSDASSFVEETHRCDAKCAMHIRLGPINKAASGTLTPSEEAALLFELRHDPLYYEEIALAANSFLGMLFPPALNLLNQYGPRLKILLLRSNTERRRSFEGRSRAFEATKSTAGAALALETTQSGKRLIDSVCSAAPSESNDITFDAKLRAETQFQELLVCRTLEYVLAGRLAELDRMRRRLVTYFEDQESDTVSYLPALVKAFKHLASNFVFEENEENAVTRCRQFDRFTEKWALLVETEISNRRRSAESMSCRPVQLPDPRRRSAEISPRASMGKLGHRSGFDTAGIRRRIEQMTIGRGDNRTPWRHENISEDNEGELRQRSRQGAPKQGGRIVQGQNGNNQGLKDPRMRKQNAYQPWASNGQG